MRLLVQLFDVLYFITSVQKYKKLFEMSTFHIKKIQVSG